MPRRKTHEEFAEEFKFLKPGAILTGTYVNNATNIDYICVRGHFTKQTPLNMKKGKICLECHKENQWKTPEQFAKEFAEARPGAILTGTYINSKTDVEYICEAKHNTSQRPDGILAGKGCAICRFLEFIGTERTIYFVELFYKDTGKPYCRKIGITKHDTIEERFKGLNKKLGYRILFELKSDSRTVVSLEQYIIKKYKDLKFYGSLLRGNLDGATECFRLEMETEYINETANSDFPILSDKEIIKVLTHFNK